MIIDLTRSGGWMISLNDESVVIMSDHALDGPLRIEASSLGDLIRDLQAIERARLGEFVHVKPGLRLVKS